MDIDNIINNYQFYVKDKKPEDIEKTKRSTLDKINDVSVLAGLMDDIRSAYDMVSESVTGKYKGLSKSTLALLVGGLAYLAMPLDIVPDLIPVAGWMDDAAVLGWGYSRVAPMS